MTLCPKCNKPPDTFDGTYFYCECGNCWERGEVYAVDFDGTICELAWPDTGPPHMDVINHLKALRKQGDKLILWTCREGELLDKAVKYCEFFGLRFDAINANLPERIAQYGGDCRKISADHYIDDKNAFMEGVNKWLNT